MARMAVANHPFVVKLYYTFQTKAIMDGDKEAAQIKTPMIYICGECHRWEGV